MDSEAILEIATAIKRLKMFPYFDIAHYILMCLLVKEDNYTQQLSGRQIFSRMHPLSCWFGSMMLCFAGGILGNFLLGEPLLGPLKDETNVLIATVVWYLINYSPFDCLYKLCNFSPVKLLISLLAEISRTHKVHHGISFALKNFPGSYVLVCGFGVLKGSASMHMRIFQRLLCGTWLPSSIDLLKPSLVTKASLVASIVFIFKYKGFIDSPEEIVYFVVMIYFSLVKLLWLLFGVDPFTPFENLFCFLIFGGIMDSLNRITNKENTTNTVSATKNSSHQKTKKE